MVQFGNVTQHTHLQQQMQDWLSIQVIGINILDQTTGEMFGQKILYTIQMILLDTVVTFTDV